MSKYHLFDGYGIELEYMIVDKDTLEVKPFADELLKIELGEYGSDFDNGMVTWSNELVCHVIELKSTKPACDLVALEREFHRNVLRINEILEKWNACLMSSAAHPLMNPFTDTKLWPHDNNEVYAIYNRIFDCRGHGWSNLQSTHLNLPFTGDEEFEKLHAAVRLVLPLLPALCASSPILEGLPTGMYDTRLKFYKYNQAKVPSITGLIVPEDVYSEKEHATILSKIATDIESYDPDKLLDPIWVNSRGAMSRFDRGSIEIRIMDIQECVQADIAIQAFVIEVIRAFVNGEFVSLHEQKKWRAEPLSSILDETMEHGEHAWITNQAYLQVFGLTSPTTAQTVWNHLAKKLATKPLVQAFKNTIEFLLLHGTLSDRILKHLKNGERIEVVYKSLCECVQKNKLFY